MIELVINQAIQADAVGETSLAIDMIVLQYQARIARYILRLVNDPELAVDLRQDTFVNAFRNIHTLRSDHALSAWLYRIATNLAIHARRKNERMRCMPLADYENTSRLSTAAPDENVMDRELVRKALNQLP